MLRAIIDNISCYANDTTGKLYTPEERKKSVCVYSSVFRVPRSVLSIIRKVRAMCKWTSIVMSPCFEDIL